MTTLKILAVHGIATGPEARTALPARWEALLKKNGVEAEVASAPWDSTGNAVQDLQKVFTDHDFRERSLLDISKTYDRWWTPVTHQVVIAFSMGQPLASAALSGCSTPLLSMGGPLGHPSWRPILRSVGLGLPYDLTGTEFWNADDPVTCMSLFGGRHVTPAGWKSVRVAVAGRESFIDEHDDELYLTHPLFLKELRRLAR